MATEERPWAAALLRFLLHEAEKQFQAALNQVLCEDVAGVVSKMITIAWLYSNWRAWLLPHICLWCVECRVLWRKVLMKYTRPWSSHFLSFRMLAIGCIPNTSNRKIPEVNDPHNLNCACAVFWFARWNFTPSHSLTQNVAHPFGHCTYTTHATCPLTSSQPFHY